MIRKLFSVFCFLFSVLVCHAVLMAAEGASPATPAGKALGVRQELPNGLVWLFSEQRGLPLVTFNLWIKGGVLRDPQGKEGLANLTAVLLTQGTKSRTATQIAQELDFLGASLSSHGGDDYATLSLAVLKKDLDAGLALFQDVLLNPNFAPAELRRKVTQIQAALKSEEDEAGVVAARTFARKLFGPFPYGRPVRGTREGLAAITRPAVVEFHRRYYRPNNAVLSVAGDLSPAEAQAAVSRTLGAWEAAPIPELKLPAPPPLDKSQVVVVDKNITQANIILGRVGIARSNPDFYAFQVMNYILGGGGFSSRLMDNIRENRGLAYSVGSSFDPGLEPGAFAVSLETKNAAAGEAVALALQELERLRDTPVSETELKDAKSYLIGSFPRKMDSLSKRAWLLNYVEFYGLGLDYPWRYPDLIGHLTPADIRQVAQKYLDTQRYLLVVVGRQAELPRLDLKAPPPVSEVKEKKDATEKSDP